MVVEQALGDVYQPLASNTQSLDLLEQPIEMAGLWLVRADVLCGDDRVEGHAESRIARGKRIAIDVAEDDQLVARRQPSQCLDGVGERRPVSHRLTERLGIRVGHLGPEIGADSTHRLAEDDRVQRTGHVVFDVGLVAAVCSEQPLVVESETTAGGPWSQRVGDPRLPVDQRAVAVEAHCAEAIEVVHRRALP